MILLLRSYLSILVLLNFIYIFPIKIDRVILSTNDNPNYIEFWPIVAKIWKEFIGIKPTLALIADKNVEIDESLGDVIRFEPINGVPTSFHAQVIRLLLPSYFENEVCITSDIDMIPLNKNYFTEIIKSYPEDSFIIYKNGYYEYHLYHFKYPMCYCASKGINFKEIFNVNKIDDIENIIKFWHTLNLGWHTDELLLFKYLANWKDFKSKCIKLGHFDNWRLNRLKEIYNPQDVKNGNYIDAHCPRPYSKHKKEIDELINLLKL